MAQPNSAGSLKRKHSDGQSDPTPAQMEDISYSAAIHDRESKFYAIYSPTIKPKDLQTLDEIASATHKVVGWRRRSNQQSINKAELFVTGSDDDGEKYAGKKIEKVLEAAGVSGACVVARWFGGVMLGPVRFTHIETCAKEAIDRYREQEAERQSKKRRLEEEQEERLKLCKSLAERDQSIVVLRALADRKEKLAKEEILEDQANVEPCATEVDKSSIVPKPGPDYTAMPLQRLQALAKARDATLSFLLKRIDSAEAELAANSKASEQPP